MNNARKPKLLGIAASLRNARWGIGNDKLLSSLKEIATKEELFEFLKVESELHLENFLQAGRKEGKDFLEIYDHLRKNKGDKGLSNSEVALAAALWAALKFGVELDHLSLSEHFLATGQIRNLDKLKEKLISADGLLLSGPVYFGDRGSLAQSLQDLIRQDHDLREHLHGKLYAGIAVGAKRNGGQETTLIYQMLDMIHAGLLALGNDSDTTAQYGGTGHAGDIGTMHKDTYGLDTSMGTGRRIGSLLQKLSHRRELDGNPKVLFLILQDRAGEALLRTQQLIAQAGVPIDATFIDIVNKKILRCLACDICPTHIDVDENYRCIISSSKDDMKNLHEDMLHQDAIVPVVLSAIDASEVVNNYQTFIERTRYLRRGDYMLGNTLVAPLIFEELGSRENYAVRMMTSMIRHHTVMAQPMIAHILDGRILNEGQMKAEFAQFAHWASDIAAARLTEFMDDAVTKYNPVGYVLSSNKDAEDEKLLKRAKMIEERRGRNVADADARLKKKVPIE
ncbi:MAG: NAD(P)H-dependent oxidoreductase [Spirochaetia bacterium]|nr:NAD(P)H-dependent oxidoreductase [Spirochaetia bacterium]